MEERGPDPGATIGILGGGQLGRMIAMAAARLGYRCHILAPEADSPAADVAASFTCAGYEDQAALQAFADAVDVITLEFENVPVSALDFLAATCPVRPSAAVLRVTQDRLAEKDLVSSLRCPVTAYARVESAADLERAAELGPGVLKTTRLGYDGKGQIRVDAATDKAAAVTKLGQPVLIHEAGGFRARAVGDHRAQSARRGRARSGREQAPPPHPRRDRGPASIRTKSQPKPLPWQSASRPRWSSRVCLRSRCSSRDGRLLVNELAPRPHNSGHWTIDACAVSQFEQQVRAVCGLPLGDPARVADAEMTNLIGHEVERWARAAGRAECPAPSLRQARGAPRPQDGARHPPQAMMSGIRSLSRWAMRSLSASFCFFSRCSSTSSRLPSTAIWAMLIQGPMRRAQRVEPGVYLGLARTFIHPVMPLSSEPASYSTGQSGEATSRNWAGRRAGRPIA